MYPFLQITWENYLGWSDMSDKFLRNVILKGVALFLLVDLLFVALNPAIFGNLSLYNHLLAGRQRFPFGEDSTQSYNLSLFNLDAMFASHVIANGLKPPDEFRIIVIGDSSIWGTLLRPEQTLSGQMNAAGLSICGKRIRVYNLGYPTISLTKDLMVMDYALRYKPDLIIWAVTLEAFAIDNQLSSPIVANNESRVVSLNARYDLSLNPNDPEFIRPSLWDDTLIGQRRSLADLFRLQVYGILWTATGIDQTYPADYKHTQIDFNTDVSYHDLQPPLLDGSKLAFSELDAGLRIAGNIPIFLINEPMFISNGINSDLRYNFLYPRWVYDQWRLMMSIRTKIGGWHYLDLWNLVPSNDFTNSAIHLNLSGESLLVEQIEQYTLRQSCP
jgi:hypothetical protein